MHQNNNQPNGNYGNKPFGQSGATTGTNQKPFDKTNYGAKGATTGGTDPMWKHGINYYAPHENAPEFVKGQIVISRDQFLEWLTQQKDTVRLDVKESKEGKLYLQVNTYEKKA